MSTTDKQLLALAVECVPSRTDVPNPTPLEGANFFRSHVLSRFTAHEDETMVELINERLAKVTFIATLTQLGEHGLEVFYTGNEDDPYVPLAHFVDDPDDVAQQGLDRFQLRAWAEEGPPKRGRKGDPAGDRFYLAYREGTNPLDACRHVVGCVNRVGLHATVHVVHSTPRFSLLVMERDERDERSTEEFTAQLLQAVQHPLMPRKAGRARTVIGLTGGWAFLEPARPRKERPAGGNGRRGAQRRRAPTTQAQTEREEHAPLQSPENRGKNANGEKLCFTQKQFDDRLAATLKHEVANVLRRCQTEWRKIEDGHKERMREMEQHMDEALGMVQRQAAEIERLTKALEAAKTTQPSRATPAKKAEGTAAVKSLGTMRKTGKSGAPPKMRAEQNHLEDVRRYTRETAEDILGAENVGAEDVEEGEVESSGDHSAGAELPTGKRAPLERTKSRRALKQSTITQSMQSQSAEDSNSGEEPRASGFGKKVGALLSKATSAGRR